MSDENGNHEDQAAKQEQAKPVGEEVSEAMSDEELLNALDGQAEETPQTGEGFANPLEALAAENARQEEEIADLKDKLLRAAAEMENLRRRTQKDVADARSFSISGFARDILGVSDNLRRAIEHVDEKDKDQAGLKSLIEGVEMTERELLNALEKNGVRKIAPVGEKFDPHFHQAMFEVEDKELPNNTVKELVQVGFVIGERVLRPAMVGVAKGGPKQPAQKQDQAAED